MIDEDARALLRAVLLVRDRAIAPALRATGISRDTAIASLGALEQAGMLQVRAGRLAALAPDLEDDLWMGVDQAGRARLHRALGRVLPPGSEDALRHEALGADSGPDGLLADRLSDMARHRFIRAGAGAAAEIAALAATLSPPSRRGDRFAEAARYAAGAGQLATARDHLAAARLLTTDASTRVDHTATLARLLVVDGHVAEGERELAEDAVRIRPRQPLLSAMLDGDRGIPLCLLGRPAEALDTTRSAWTSVGESPDPPADSVRLAAAAVGALTGHDLPGVQGVLDRLLEQMTVLPEPAARPWTMAISCSQALVLGGEPARGAELLDRLVSAGQRVGAPILTVLPLTLLAEAHMRLGRWDRAAQRLRDARRSEARLSTRPWIVHSMGTPSRLAALRGDTGSAAALLTEVRLATSLEGVEVLHRAVEGIVRAADGCHEPALEAFAAVDAFVEQHGPSSPELTRHHLDHLLSALATGEGRRVDDVIRRARDAMGPMRSPWGAALLAGLNAIRDEDVQAAGHAAMALDTLGPWEAARVRLWIAEHASGPARHGAAAAAVRGFRMLDAQLWLQRATTVLEPAYRPLTALTSRQRQIAAAVADGMSNAQIAEVLGISTQTVANHLSRIYRVLEVRGRAELTHRYRT